MATEVADVEASVAHQPRQAPHQPAIVDKVADGCLDARLQRVVLAGGHRRGRVVAIEDDQLAARRQHAERLGQRTLGPDDMAQQRVEDDHVEARFGVRQIAPIRLFEREVVDIDRQLSRTLQQDARRVNTHNVTDARPPRQGAGDGAAAAPDLEHARGVGKGHVRQIGVQHGALLGVGGANLESVGQLPHDGGIDLGDGGVDVRHAGELRAANGMGSQSGRLFSSYNTS